jgi:hypothetical protein
VSFPKPAVGKWELRNAYIVDIQRIPSMQRGYCYAHGEVFLDQETFEPIDVDLYDSNSSFWKGILNIYFPTPLPNSPVTALGRPGNICSTLWDIPNDHLILPLCTIPILIPRCRLNRDSYRWGTPGGMSEVLQ